KRRDAEQKTDQPGEKSGDGNRDEVVDVVPGDEDRARVGAERHQRPMTERDLAAVPDQDVQAHDHDGEDQHQGPLARLEARDHGRQPDEEEDGDEHEPVARRGVPQTLLELNHQTLRTAARPKRPFGLMTSTPTMIASATASSRSPPTNGRYAPARLTVRPTMSPPTTAPTGLSMPPSTAAAKA